VGKPVETGAGRVSKAKSLSRAGAALKKKSRGKAALKVKQGEIRPFAEW
jgi:hypothetical protein